MGKFCEVCGKGVSLWQQCQPLQPQDAPHLGSQHAACSRELVNGVAKRMFVCTRCLRSNKVERAL